MRYWRLFCESNEGPGQSREANSTCQSSAEIYFALGTHDVLALSGWSDCWLWINIYIRASGQMWCAFCVRKRARNCTTGQQGAGLLKKRKKKHIESKLLLKQNYTNNRPQQMVQLGSGTHPLNRNVKNTIPLIGWHGGVLRSNASSHASRTTGGNLCVTHISHNAIKIPVLQ